MRGRQPNPILAIAINLDGALVARCRLGCRPACGRVTVVARRGLRCFRTDLEDDLLANLHGPRFRATRLGDVSRPRTRDGHEPGRARLTVIRGDGRGAFQGRAVRIVSRARQQEDMTTRHPPDVEPPIVRLGDVQAESVVVNIGPAGQDLPTTRQGIVEQSRVIVWVSQVCSRHELVEDVRCALTSIAGPALSSTTSASPHPGRVNITQHGNPRRCQRGNMGRPIQYATKRAIAVAWAGDRA
jgi:hypothetical protein